MDTRKRAFFASSLLALLGCLLPMGLTLGEVESSNTNHVHNVNSGLDYTSIQDAIDAAETLNGHTILVAPGTYFEHVTVSKSLALFGQERSNTVIDGGGDVVIHVTANDVLVGALTLKHGFLGIYLDHSNNSVLFENTLVDMTDYYAVYASYSNNCTIRHNSIASNLCSGILVTNSFDFRISNNYVHNNTGYGINANASMNGLIMQNEAFENFYDGIGLGEGCQNCIITGNNVSNNGLFGIWLDSDSVDNIIYDNNIINNGRQASVYVTNHWDNGVEGNYWSDYTGVDQDYNGIGDTPIVIGENNTDNYPLMGMFQAFEAKLVSDVDVVSNSSITDFVFFESNSTIRMHVANRTVTQTSGFCRVRIPHSLMTEPNVKVDGVDPSYWNYTLYDDGDNRWIYFAYQHSPREVSIQGRVGEFLLYWILAAMVVVAAIPPAILIYLRRLRKRGKTTTQP